MEEILTIRVPKGTRRRLERRAKAQKLSVSQLVRRALEQDELLASLASARAELLPQARAQGIYTPGVLAIHASQATRGFTKAAMSGQIV